MSFQIFSSSRKAKACRLCGGATAEVMRLLVLRKHDVGYFRCDVCGSLQTEFPYWLKEAYAQEGTDADIGAADRCIDLALKTSTLLRLISLPKDAECLDYGSGIGLYARLMRDRGYLFTGFDKYRKPFFIDHFHVEDINAVSPRLTTAFEVLEHLPNPSTDLLEIFGRGTDLVIATTEVYMNQSADWWYLGPDAGQHVFFYSGQALRLIGSTFRYRYQLLHGMHLFWRHDAANGLDGKMMAAFEFARDPQQFWRAMMEDFVRHFGASNKFDRDMQLVAAKLQGT